MESLPEWCTPLPDAKQMRRIDSWAIEQRGVPSLRLMERAGEGVAAAVQRLCPDGLVTVICGKGNNGGDGLVAARLLRERGRPVSVIALAGEQELGGDALQSLLALPGERPLRLLASEGGTVGERPVSLALDPAAVHAVRQAKVIVDALLGTGFEGVPRGGAAAAIELISGSSAPVISVDVPSGVDASSGCVEGAAVRATLTVTFHSAKPGLWIHPGKAHSGQVEAIDIGIPRGSPMEANAGLIDSDVLLSLPRRTASSTKFSSGHVLVVGGSRGLSGAPRMTAEGAMRAGAGYVTVCVPSSLQPVLAGSASPELMTRALAEQDGALAEPALNEVLEAASGRAGSLALGTGLGRKAAAAELARSLAERASLPLVLDADGLNAHAEQLPALAERTHSTVLTPHAGELGRLLGIDSAQIQARRLAHVRAAADAAKAVVVLKGDDTLIAEPGGIVAVSRGGSPALASAGTGDVLCGAVAALLAQGLEPFLAASAGVLLHASAGRIAARDVGSSEGVIASDVIAALPRARREGLE
jgi:ADP-dependent NAD(P)H-hydrate dehydratase / NAD(P)H-hydrate epimerase